MVCTNGHETKNEWVVVPARENAANALVAERQASDAANDVAGWTCPKKENGVVCGATAKDLPQITESTGQEFWVVPCPTCSFLIALDFYTGDNAVLTTVPESFDAFCLACRQPRRCAKSRIEQRTIYASTLDFQPHPAFAKQKR
jgi:hypothetical protein